MKEPTYGTACGSTQQRPLSLAPDNVLQAAANGRMPWVGGTGDMTDEAFTRQYAAILLRERGQ